MADPPPKLSSDGKKSGPVKPLVSPPADEVRAFHDNSDVDAHQGAHHHTLGAGATQAAPGDHSHDGGSSAPLWTGTTVSGIRGSAAYFASLEAALVAKGITVTATGP